MPILQTAEMQPSLLPSSVSHQAYCGLDNCLTVEVRQEEEKILQDHPFSQGIYSFERALQAPYLEVMNRGFAVDQSARQTISHQLGLRISALQTTLNELASTFGHPFLNPRSPVQLKSFFFDTLQFPEIWTSKKGVRKLSLDREALEKLHERYLYARPFVNCILKMRELAKQKEVFDTEIDADGRLRTSYNIAGTETGRPSSSTNAFGTGGNIQNITSSLRFAFIADSGYKICSIDAEQVEARDVGYFCGCLFDDWSFLDSCESGDLHTNNAKLIWPELDWPGDPRGDRQIADQIFYRDFTRRDMAKRGGHLSNYFGTAWTAARHLKVPLPIMEDFQSRYCRGPNCAYPCLPRYWQWIAEQLQTIHCLTTPFGRQRHFFGRSDDDATLREAIAGLPQSTTADRTNLCWWRIWKYMPEVQLLAQTYDSVTFQFPEELNENEVVSRAMSYLSVPLTAPSGRIYDVPWEAKVGWNWGNYTGRDEIAKAISAGKTPPRLNEDGLKKWSPDKPDSRRRTARGIQSLLAAK